MAKAKTHEEFLRDVFEMVGDEYEVKGKYTRAREKVMVRHNICGHEWMIQAHSLLRGYGCPPCGILKRADKKMKTHDSFVEEVFNLVELEYSVVGKYKGSENPVKMRHNQCGHEWSPNSQSFLSGNRCPPCSEIKRIMSKTIPILEYKKRIKEQVGNEYIVMDLTRRENNKVELHHEKCNKSFITNVHHFLNGRRCPNCYESAGESRVRMHLESNGYKFITQQTFPDCVYKTRLRFDFAVYDGDDISFLIEYDGEQHFKPKELFGGIKQFKIIQTRDAIKNKYCSDNQIPLIRIRFDSKNIEKELENRIKELERPTFDGCFLFSRKEVN